MRRPAAAAPVLIAAALAAAGPTIPSEFESPGTQLANISSLGGVASYGAALDPATIYAGGSLLVSASLVGGSFLNFSTFTIGAPDVTGPDLAVPAGADTLSITIDWPGPQTLSCYIAVREDDDNDGAISPGDDDSWETADFFLQPGTHVYNIPTSALQLANPGSGNGAQNFATAPRLACLLTFESRPSYPGGRITGPIALRVDHLGLYAGEQSLPGAACPADWDGGGAVNSGDISAYLASWLASLQNGALVADFNADGMVNSSDISAFLTSWLDAVQNGC